jgi:pyruvate,water dikinase
MRSARRTLTLGEVSVDDLLEVGGKASALGVLAAADLPVPAGFVITASALGAISPTSVSAGALAQALGDAVLQSYRQLGDVDALVAVRSSAIDEDGLDVSFAGQHETVLGVRGPEALLAAIASVRASLHSGRATAYRERHAIGSPTRGIAVIVQRMIDAHSAGVVFTTDLQRGDSDTLLIEAAWGLGESVVDGSVTPDRFFVDKHSGERRRMEIADKRTMTVLAASGTAVVDVPAARRTLPSLSAANVREVAALAQRVEEVRGGECDIEWALDGAGAVHLLQARPITTSAPSVR